MQIFRIRIKAIRADMSEHDARTFGVAALSQDDAEGIGRIVWTQWMKAHPRVPSTMTLDWPHPDELGDNTIYWAI